MFKKIENFIDTKSNPYFSLYLLYGTIPLIIFIIGMFFPIVGSVLNIFVILGFSLLIFIMLGVNQDPKTNYLNLLIQIFLYLPIAHILIVSIIFQIYFFYRIFNNNHNSNDNIYSNVIYRINDY
jgi:hypothetical protein